MSSTAKHVLRLSQFAENENTFRVELTLDNIAPVHTRFSFLLSDQDQEDLRWYLEDYLQYPLDPNPTIAARVETRMRDIGIDLFRKVFESGETARRMWARLQPNLNDTRVEIITTVQHAAAIPWELMRDPETDQPLALQACAFTRAPSDQAQPPKLPKLAEGNQIRILLVICRPNAGEDVPFRSVASRILKGLSEQAREMFQLDVLRPPTFEQLSKTLQTAKRAGKPYHIVHFDGHGMYAEVAKKSDTADWLKHLGRLMLSGPREGSHGYLLFENPNDQENYQLVDGPALGKVLVDTDVPVLVLNACRSAHADAPAQDKNQPPEKSSASIDDPHSAVRAYGSLAQEVMDAGVAGVVAMRYNVYVVTAAQFVADLYGALVAGQSLGEAVTLGRQQLSAQPQREIAYNPIPLQDWLVPIVYETTAINLFPRVDVRAQHAAPLRLTIDKEMTTRGAEVGLPPRPDVGFFGRDETLLALDRAFDSQQIVILHAFAGSGKTTTAAEFARWYALTGGVTLSGVQAPVLFTSFEQYKPLPRVLDVVGQVFEQLLEQNKIQWLALTYEQRRTIALQIFKAIPVLWIWDNVEQVAGFPAGTESKWNEKEISELRKFLADARETKAKFLLTSRRDEREWLGDLPRRIIVPPMPMQERVQLARALAEKVGRRITDVDDWSPLLRFTQGNPLTITVVVGEALRKGVKTRLEIGDFVARLRAGEQAFEDEANEGRSKSLGASLSYGFENAFTETERKQLALLHFFQGFVEIRAFWQMGNLKNIYTGEDLSLPEMRDLTPEAGIALLDRAAEVGLLTAHGNGYYSIHPALPWYFKSLFDRYYPTEEKDESGKMKDEEKSIHPSSFIPHPSPSRAFVEAMGALGNYYLEQYDSGNRDVIGVLGAEEANLLHARRMARANGYWRLVISTMQGLRVLDDHTGRRGEWAALVNEIVPDFVDPTTNGPLAGREEDWGLLNDYRVQLAEEAQQWTQAERLQRIKVDKSRSHVESLLAVQSENLTRKQRADIRTLAMDTGELGRILFEQGKTECASAHEEAARLLHWIDDRAAEAVAAFNLGHAYKNIPALRDLAQAERWYRRDLELEDPRDQLGRGKVYNQLGLVAYEHFKDARNAKKPEAELLKHLNDAVQFYQQALDLLPPNAVDDLAVTHNALGALYYEAGDIDRALPHYREAIRYDELGGNLYKAGNHRFNVAIALAQAGRLADAREYALAALRNFETFGNRAEEMIEQTKGLVREIERLMGHG